MDDIQILDVWGAGRADPIRPECAGRHSPDPSGRVADLRPVLDHQQVGAESHVGAARDAVAVHLADGRLVRAEQAHEAAQVAAHHLVVDHRVPGALGVVVRRHHRRINGGTRRDIALSELVGHPALSRGDEVVAAAEPAPVPGERDGVHLRVQVAALDAR